MHIGNTVCLRPPGRKPGNPVMLIDDKIKLFPATVPLSGIENRRPNSSTSKHGDSFNGFSMKCTRKIMGKPENFMPSFRESRHVALCHPLGSSSERVLRISPIEHQKTHL